MVRRIALIGGHGRRSGVPKHIEHICRALSGTAEITVISDVNEGGFAFAANLGVKHLTIPHLATTLNPRKILNARAQLADTVKSHDLIWAHARQTIPMCRHILRHSDGTMRLMVTYHGVPFVDRPVLEGFVFRQLETRALRRTPPHDLLFLTDRDKDAVAPFAARYHRLRVLGNCSDLGALPPISPAPYPTLIMTTRAGRQKNLKAAANVFAALPSHFRLVLLGSRTDTTVKAMFARRLRPEDFARVSFHGPVADVAPFLRAADGYLLTSRYEGMSIGALEAMEAGLPVFMPKVGGAKAFQSHHPMCTIIEPDYAVASAHAIAEGVATFRADLDQHVATIEAAWAQAFHPSTWDRQVRAVVDQVFQ